MESFSYEIFKVRETYLSQSLLYLKRRLLIRFGKISLNNFTAPADWICSACAVVASGGTGASCFESGLVRFGIYICHPREFLMRRQPVAVLLPSADECESANLESLGLTSDASIRQSLDIFSQGFISKKGGEEIGELQTIRLVFKNNAICSAEDRAEIGEAYTQLATGIGLTH